MAETWITVQEAADISGYNAEYIRWLIRGGEIKAKKFGIVWQVSRSSLLTYKQNADTSSDKRRGAKPKQT